MADVSVLDVLLYNKPVGSLTHVGGDRTLFAFDDDYIDNRNRPVLSLGFKDEFGELITEFRPTRAQLTPFFSNLLPEGHMRSYLAERAGVKPQREFFLLRALGADLPGAITVEAADGEQLSPGDATGDDRDLEEQRDNALHFSLAGVQLKFSAVSESSGGLTIPANGIGGSWIVKLPSREFERVPENEYSMLTLARMIGIDVPALKLVDLAAIKNLPNGVGTLNGQALAIERFDRLSDGSRVHIEDFAQIFGIYPEDKYRKANYRNIATVIAAESNDEDIEEFVRRLTFNMLIGNADMHLKNWSMIYPDRRNAVLAPAYDFVSTVPYIPDEKAALNVSRTKRFSEFSEDELSHLAAKAGLSENLVIEAARETVVAFHEAWATERANLPLSTSVAEAIEAHWKTVPIASV